MESILGNGGHFLSKDFSTRLLNYSKTGIKNLLKKPTNMNATNEAVLANPLYQTNPVRKEIAYSKISFSYFFFLQQQKAAVEVWKTKDNLRGANGALVRAPLLGIIKFWDGTTVIENTTECCRITHPDPRCMISCVIASTIIAR